MLKLASLVVKKIKVMPFLKKEEDQSKQLFVQTDCLSTAWNAMRGNLSSWVKASLRRVG